jgi:RecJ-like exonuclease
MLPEKAIIKYSLVASCFGLLGVFLIGLYIEPGFEPLENIGEGSIGRMVKTQGYISDLRLSNTSTLFITLESQGSKIPVVKFSENSPACAKGDFVSVSGEVGSYRGSLQIVAKSIEVLN